MKFTDNGAPMDKITLETVHWSTLNDIDDIPPINDTDFEVLAKIKDVLVEHDCTNRFGVCLLHKHFEVGQDEVAVEYTDVEARVSKVVVQQRVDNPDTDTIQTMWRFREDGALGYDTVCEKVCHYFLGHKQRHKRVGK